MPKANKRSIKFLRKAAKSEHGVKKMGRKRVRKEEPEMTHIEVEKAISMKDLKPSEPPKKKKSSIKQHQDELDSLKEKDPEFFNYLQKNDAGLLDFEDDDDAIEESDESEESEDESGDMEEDDVDNDSDDDIDEDDHDSKISGAGGQDRSSIEVTAALVDELVTSSKSGSLTSFRKLLSVFRATCLPNSQGGDDEPAVDGRPTSRYVVSDPEVYEYVMVEVLEHAGGVFASHLDLSLDGLTREKLTNLGDHPKWKKLQMFVLSFYKSVLHTLASLSTQISDTSTADDPAPTDRSSTNQGGSHVAAYIVSCLEPYIPLLSPVSRLAKGVIKVLLRLWSQGPAPENDTSNVRGHSFLRIRQMSILLPGTITEECFRAIYLCFARTAKSFSEQSRTSVIFMSQCVTELYRTDVAHAYQQAFMYTRQLALHLRTALLKKTPEATKQVLTWQFLNCLRLWTRLLCAMPAEDDLGPLVFPLSQVLNGVVVASPSAVYLPLHFHIISCLQQLAAHAEVFIPTCPRLLAILESHEISTSSTTPSTDPAPNLQHIVRLPAGAISKPPVRDVVVQTVITLLRYDLEIYRFHVGLPEYLYITTKKLKAFNKKCKVAKWRDLTRALANQCEQYSSVAKTRRLELGIAPMSVKGFEPLREIQKPLPPCASERLAKLMSSDKSALLVHTGDKTLIVDTAAASPGKGLIRAATSINPIDSGSRNHRKDEDGSDSEDESGDDDEYSSEYDEGNTDVSAMQDEIRAMEWSDDEGSD
mmetsp:Transcript_22453/g.32753  ORF Transcript_22453/g.32753 Transcript_22453/m.32753 type:complete len:759 (+) Transcript_22453:58-2334(+)